MHCEIAIALAARGSRRSSHNHTHKDTEYGQT